MPLRRRRAETPSIADTVAKRPAETTTLFVAAIVHVIQRVFRLGNEWDADLLIFVGSVPLVVTWITERRRRHRSTRSRTP